MSLIKGLSMQDMEMIFEMIRFADKMHRGQKRRGSGLDYFSHPMVGAFLIPVFKKSGHLGELICAFIGHDLLEDTKATFAVLSKKFTPLVAILIQELTTDKTEEKAMGKNEYLKKKLAGISNWGLVLKLIDRLYNIMDKPKYQYVVDTLDLLTHLKQKRKLTATQKAIMAEIYDQCDRFLKTNYKGVA